MAMTVAIAGLGSIGLPLARALDLGVDGLRLIAVAARDQTKAAANLAGFRTRPQLVSLAELAEADIVVEAVPASLFEQVALPAIEGGKIFVTASVGALLPRMHYVHRVAATGGRIVVPTGALLGLDAVRAAAEGPIESVTMETRKPPAGLKGAPYLERNHISVDGLTEPCWSSMAMPSKPPPASRPMSMSPPHWRLPASVPSGPRSKSGPIRR